MKIGRVVRILLLVCLGLTPQMASAMQPRLGIDLLGVPASARSQGLKVHQATGEVLAFSPGSLVLLHARGRTKSKMNFTLTAHTEKDVSLSNGERIIVYYQEIGGRMVVARIRPAPPIKHLVGAAKVHQATGEVLAFSPDSLLLLHARGRGKQRMPFVLTAETVREVSLSKGERITVFYREIGGRNIVERIRAAAPARRTRG